MIMRNGRKRLTKICGATNRRGLPCQCKLLLKGGRCKFHGGMSTGAKTPEGKARALAAMREGWKRWNAERSTRPQVVREKRPKPVTVPAFGDFDFDRPISVSINRGLSDPLA